MIKIIFIFCCSALCLVADSRIVFPTEETFFTDCQVNNGTNGTCINLNNCIAAQTAINISTCYHDGPDHYVCCKNNLWSGAQYHRINADCGVPTFEIIKGIQTEYKEFPYMAALGWEALFSNDPYDYKCGGVLITPTFVLTAAHCAKLNGLEPSVVLVGGTNLTDNSIKPINVSKVFIHPEYKEIESYHDIALLQLQSFSNQPPICLWSLYEVDKLNVTAVGYGHTQFAGIGSESLLKTYMSIILNKDCASYYATDNSLPNGLTEKQLCAKDMERGSDTCQGDSGGPLILYSKSSFGISIPFIVGITSFGRACAQDPPGVYTRVSEYIDWIESIVFTQGNGVYTSQPSGVVLPATYE